MVTCSEIDFASPEMDEALVLRYEVLREPLQLSYNEEDISGEWNSYHLAAFNPDGQIAGILVLKPVSDDAVKMRQVAIRNNLQKKGIGKILVTFSEDFSKRKGFKRMELHARLTAVPFYEQLGYTTKGDMFKEIGIDHFFMSKEL